MNASQARSGSAAASVSNKSVFVPPPITKIDDTGLSQLWLQDLALKILYFQGYLSGFRVAEEMAFPLPAWSTKF
jgi:hypothetical protein